MPKKKKSKPEISVPVTKVSADLPPSQDPSLGLLFLKTIALTFFFLALFILLTLAGLGWYVYAQLHSFASQTQTTIPGLYETFKTGWETPVTQTDQHKNILILGVDTLSTRGNAPPLTDTMMIASLNLTNGQIRTLSLPRDLWSDDYKTRINALYAYGLDRYPDQPQQFPTEVISEITQIPIHHTVVLSLDEVGALIDLLGGIEINVEQAFIDPAFPRTDVDVTVERDPAKLYETVEFQAGSQTMNGERALKFIRSRHSTGTEGDDVARSKRQQLVIAALMKKLTNPRSFMNPDQAAQLYLFYINNFDKYVSLNQAIATVKSILPYRETISFSGSGLSIHPTETEGVLVHPPTQTTQNQWVYTVRDIEKFRREVKTKLGLPLQD